MDELEERIDELAEAEELAALRPEMDGSSVIEHLGIQPGPEVGQAMVFLMEVRLEEGLIGEEAVRARLDQWWATRA
jgi:poly(A) polymerase